MALSFWTISAPHTIFYKQRLAWNELMWLLKAQGKIEKTKKKNTQTNHREESSYLQRNFFILIKKNVDNYIKLHWIHGNGRPVGQDNNNTSMIILRLT